jgi:hypothetical protein
LATDNRSAPCRHRVGFPKNDTDGAHLARSFQLEADPDFCNSTEPPRQTRKVPSRGEKPIHEAATTATTNNRTEQASRQTNSRQQGRQTEVGQTDRTTDRGRADRQDDRSTHTEGRDRTATGTSIYDAPNIDPMTQQSTSSQRHPDNQQPPYAAQFSTQQGGNVSTSAPEKAPTYTRHRPGRVNQVCSQPVLAKLIERDYRHTTHRQGQAYMMPQHRVSQTEAV